MSEPRKAAIYVRVSTPDQQTAMQESELLDYVERRGWTTLDRLARSLRQLLSISEEARLSGVHLISLKNNVDTTQPAGQLVFNVLASVSEFERELLRQRVKSGMDQARRAGRCIGRPARRRFTQSEVAHLRDLHSRGVSIRKLATEFNSTQWMVSRLTKDAVAV